MAIWPTLSCTIRVFSPAVRLLSAVLARGLNGAGLASAQASNFDTSPHAED